MSSAIRLDIKSKTIKFGDDGEEIIGLYGRLEGDKPLEQKFVSIGFIMNSCSDDTLAEASSESVARVDMKYRSGALMTNQKEG